DVRSVAFSEANPHEVITASDDGTAKIWDVLACPNGDQAEKSVDCSMPPITLKHEGSVFWAGFSEDGSAVMTASLDDTIQVWSALGGPYFGFPMGGAIPLGREIDGGEINREGNLLLTSSKGGTAQIWSRDLPMTGAGQPVTVPGFKLMDAKLTKDGLFM